MIRLRNTLACVAWGALTTLAFADIAPPPPRQAPPTPAATPGGPGAAMREVPPLSDFRTEAPKLPPLAVKSEPRFAYRHLTTIAGLSLLALAFILNRRHRNRLEAQDGRTLRRAKPNP